MESENTFKKLKEKGRTATIQRLAVLECLRESHGHPTADELYQSLRQQYPTLSRATVYNCLQVLKEAGLIQELTIEKDKARFDPDPEPHHHFFCRRCKTIFDFQVNCPVAGSGCVEGHQIEEVQAYFYGICESCLKEEKRAVA